MFILTFILIIFMIILFRFYANFMSFFINLNLYSNKNLYVIYFYICALTTFVITLSEFYDYFIQGV